MFERKFMITKIKKDVNTVTWFGWLTFAMAAVALWFTFVHRPFPPHRGPKKEAPAAAAVSMGGGNGPSQPNPPQPSGDPEKPKKPKSPKFFA